MSRNVEALVVAEVCEMKNLEPPLDPDSTLSDLGMDSLDLVEVVQTVEDEFGIRVTEQEAAGIETLGQALELLREKAG